MSEVEQVSSEFTERTVSTGKWFRFVRACGRGEAARQREAFWNLQLVAAERRVMAAASAAAAASPPGPTGRRISLLLLKERPCQILRPGDHGQILSPGHPRSDLAPRGQTVSRYELDESPM